MAAEGVIVQCFNKMAAALDNGQPVSKTAQIRVIKEKHKGIMKPFDAISTADKRRYLSEHTELTLRSMYDLPRQQRNELGHPQEAPPDLDREAAFVYFRRFPPIIQPVEELVEFANEDAARPEP